MKKTNKLIYPLFSLIIFTLVISLLFIFLSYSGQIKKSQTQKFITINNQKIYIEIADTPEKRAQGLSKHKYLPANSGMLFIFNRSTMPAFWMKDMDFPIDIIWIKDNEIKGIEKNVPIPNSQNYKHYIPPTEINYVLEVNAGYSDKHQLKVGDRINGLDLI